VVVSDGAGGAIIAWADYRSGIADIYAQRIDAAGVPIWAADGVPIRAAAGAQEYPAIVSDGSGGAIIAWLDISSSHIYVQRVTASGKIQWTAGGRAVCTFASQYIFAIQSDGSGGAVIAWEDTRVGDGTRDIYAQRVDASGNLLWSTGGVAVCTAVWNQEHPALVSDGSGGAIIVWMDYRVGMGYAGLDIYAQRVNREGTPQWNANGAAICVAGNEQAFPAIASDGYGGAIISWQDTRIASDTDIYAQLVTSKGETEWGANGISMCSSAGAQFSPRILSDGAGGAFLAWNDLRGGSELDIYAQRVDGSGTVQWSFEGIAVSAAPGDQGGTLLMSDGAGGVFVAWMDSRGAALDVYAQRVSASAAVLWTIDGEAICTAENDQFAGGFVSDGSGGAIIAWTDDRLGSGGSDIFAQQINSRGVIGYLPPVVHSILDVPGDQGGRVNVAWDASPFDYLAGEITEYTVWRALETSAALAMLESGGAMMSSPMSPAGGKGASILRLAPLNGETYYWELVASLDAYRLRNYSKVTSTLFDSTAACGQYHYFQIIAHTSDPAIFYVSDPDSGYSVDNLAPAPPAGLAGEQEYSPAGLRLTWEPNDEADLAEYAIYRGTSSDFAPGPGNLVASTFDTLYLDGGWHWDGGYYYKVAAVDVHGNESEYALLAPDGVTGSDSPKTPVATYLAQNFPNPFNPTTRIAFGLNEPARVTLRIYDAAGRLVRVLAEGDREAGAYEESWDGRDASGRAVASGIWFYRLEAGAFSQTKKMILLR
jgi:hypothetical protein